MAIAQLTPGSPVRSLTFGRVAVGAGRVVMMAVILAQLATMVLLRLPTSTLDHLLADLRGGRVAELQIQDDEDFAGRVLGRGAFSSDDAVRVRWRTTDGSWHTFLTRDQPRHVVGSEPDGQGDRSVEIGGDGFDDDPVVTIIEDELERIPVDRDPRLDHPLPLGHWVDHWAFAALLTWIVLLIVLLVGPQPRRVTKWGWFWLLSLPLGIGHLALLAVEAPWSRRARVLPEPRPHDQQRHTPAGDRRLTGGPALAVAIAGSIVLSLAIRAILDLLG